MVSPLLCCIRIALMNTSKYNRGREGKSERFLVPFLGFSAVLVSMLAFLVLLYIITIVVRFLFVFG